MPTTGVVNGKLLRLYDGSNVIGKATESSISFSGETRDTSNKDSGGWREVLPGLKSATISCSSLLAFDATHGYEELLVKFIAGTAITAKFSTEVTGDYYLSGDFYITSLEVNAPNEENSTMSITLESTGAITGADVA